MIKVELKDGSIKEVEAGISVIEFAKSISEGLARMATCARVNGDVVDLRYELNEDCKLEILTFESDLDGKKAYWHTTSHIMAQAIKRLFGDKEVKLAIGPSIDTGFYYDIDCEHRFSEEDYAKIEEEMTALGKNMPVYKVEPLLVPFLTENSQDEERERNLVIIDK